MPTRRFLLLLPLLLLALAGLGYASSCGTLPSGASYCQQLSIQNTQTTATTANTQIMITYNALAYQSYLAANMMNIEAYNSVSGAIIPMWLEGNIANENVGVGLSANTVTLWLKLPDAIAASTTDNNIYFGYFPTTSQEWGTNYGAAPQLFCASGCPTTSYAQADNGNVVFNVYDNFSGTTCNAARWKCSAAFTVNNGISLTSGSIYSLIEYNPQAYVWEGYISQEIAFANGGLIWNPDQSSFCAADVYSVITSTNEYELRPADSGTCPGSTNIAPALLNSYAVISVWASSTAAYATANYIPAVSSTSGFGASTALYFGLANDWNAKWVRLRMQPPNNIQPTVTFGSIQSIASSSLTFNPSAQVAYGTSVSATATCLLSSDTCAVQSPLGTNLCSGTGSCTYSIPNYLAAGSYTYYANDLTLGTNQAGALTVNQATILLYFNSPLCQTQVWTGTACTTTANIVSINNQLTGNFYLNNVFLASTNTITSDTENSIGAYAYTFNTLGNGNYLAASNTLSFDFYENVYAKNVLHSGAVSISTFAYPTSPFTYNTYYPIKLYTSSPVNTLSYSLYQTYGATTTLLQANVLNVSYIPPANQPTGNYIYSIDNFQQGDPQVLQTVVSANVLNMTDMYGSLTFNSPELQLLPNAAYFPYGSNAFTAKPSSWSIKSDKAANQHNNFTGSQYNTEQFSNANLSYYPAITLNYPFVSFVANALNNPGISNIILEQYTNTTSNSLISPSAPDTRKIYQIIAYSELTSSPINANTTVSGQMMVNNYSISFLSTTPTPAANTFYIYVPQSNYQNPIIYFFNQTAFSTATGYIPVQNNFFDTKKNSTSWNILHIYLVPSLNGSSYGMTASSCNNYAGGDYVQVLLGPAGSQKQVQLYKMSQFPFSLPLLNNGYPYQFVLFTANGTEFYSSAISTWLSPISINAGCPTINIPQVIIPNVQYFCSANSTQTGGLYVACTGKDMNSQVTQWIINFTNQTSLLYSTVLKSYVVNSSAFSVNYTYPSNKSSYPVRFTYKYSQIGDPTGTGAVIVGINQEVAAAAYYFYFYVALILILLPMVLAYFKQDLWILIEVAVISIIKFLPFNILPFTLFDMGVFYIIAALILIYDFTLRR